MKSSATQPWFAALGTVFSLAPGLAAPADEPGPSVVDVGVTCSGPTVWVFATHEDKATGKRTVRCAFQPANGPSPEWFRAGPTVTGRVIHAAAVGTDLHAFFSDGSHRRFVPPPHVGVPDSLSGTTTETNLPDAALPLALAVDNTSQMLYALVETDVARSIRPPLRAEGAPATKPSNGSREAQDVVETGSTPALEAEESPDESKLSSPTTVVAYEGASWHIYGSGPTTFQPDRQGAIMCVHGGTVHVLYRSAASQDGSFLYQRADDDLWTAPVPVLLLGSPDHVVASWGDGGLILSWTQWQAEGHTVHTRPALQTGRMPSIELTGEGGRPLQWAEPFAIDSSGDRLRIAWAAEKDVLLGDWSLADGTPVIAPRRVRPLRPGPISQISPSTRELIQFGVLAAVLSGVFALRRDRLIVPASIATDQLFARLQRRSLGLLIDLLILAPVYVSILYALWRREAPDLSPEQQLLEGIGFSNGSTYWSRAIVGATFALYGSLFEPWLGATPGKRLCGCRVVSETGDAASSLAIWIRNACRIIEFQFVPIALLVLITPNRQRLGDIVARTIVVETHPNALLTTRPDVSESNHDSESGAV